MTADEIEQRAVAAYLGLAIGDALGATVEFMTPREIVAEYGRHDRIRGGGWLRLKPGHVTDDTTMALALGRSILETGRVDAAAAARAFDDWMRSKPVDIGNTVRRGILEFRRTGVPMVARSEHDAGNGACMRVLPVALATFGHSGQEVERAALEQARVTHNNPLSDAGTLCCTRMVQLALGGASLRDLMQGPVQGLVAFDRRFHFREKSQQNPSGYVVDTLRAVFQAFFDTDSFEDCLVDVVNRGGDADTTGAIAGMIAGAYYGLAAIPSGWRKSLDRGAHDACVSQARSLLSLSAAEQAALA